MALYKLLVRINMNSGAAADVATWTHGLDLASLPDDQALGDIWTAAMLSTSGGAALRAQCPGWALRQSVELAPAAGGAAVRYAALTGQLGVASATLPSQAAISLIAMVAGNRGPRAGARWMIGPLGNSGSNGRPSAAQMQGPITYARALHAAMLAYGAGLVVLRNGGLTSEPITHLSVGNTFGSVGRRRLEVTARTITAI